ncbi:MAG: PcfJ domain-containing protein, partial [Lachnospiraceae bacterium]|nr:PcfJ domain-containing protein [Lachnospiraceae bacterium]
DRERAEKEAQRMREKFPGAEEILREMKARLEYRNGEYMIIVPERLVDITTEGAALHHCVGTSDRYFERIRNHETYICFLRKVSEPDIPYYTIEVEPGGTVRQHRGYLDEEPEIELVKPFIREWQRELKRRLTEEDRQRAKNSAVLRQKNIDELKAKNNKRVLDGLMEDLMEAEAV